MGWFENLQYKFDSMKTDLDFRKNEKEGERLYKQAMRRIEKQEQKRCKELIKEDMSDAIEQEKKKFREKQKN